MGQDNFSNFTEFPFLLFPCLVKKKKKMKTQFLRFWGCPGSVPLTQVHLAFLFLHLSCPWVDSLEMSQGPSLHPLSECRKAFRCSCPCHPGPPCFQWTPAASCGILLLLVFQTSSYLPVLLPAHTVIPRRSCDVGGFYSSAIFVVVI